MLEQEHVDTRSTAPKDTVPPPSRSYELLCLDEQGIDQQEDAAQPA